jgi:hypothetical protein
MVLAPVMAVRVEVPKEAVPVGFVPVDQFDPVAKAADPGAASQVAFWARATGPMTGDRHVPANKAASRRRARGRRCRRVISVRLFSQDLLPRIESPEQPPLAMEVWRQIRPN